MRCVPARDFTVGKALAWRSAIDESAPYQREGAVWSLEQQQLFIDSLLNGYDVPKIYLHDLRGKHPTKVYAIVDGKQRLTTIWRFLRDQFALAPDFRIIEANLPDLPADTPRPKAGQRFSELDPAWQRELTRTYLAVVLIQNATPDDIEDLFSRLNNGEPLNASEKRNALGGSMAQLTRELARHPFFTDRLPFGNDRHQHFDLAAKVLLIEQTQHAERGAVPDLQSASLDRFVRDHRTMTNDERERLKEWALVPLSYLCRVFLPQDPLLGRQAAVPLAYLFAKGLRSSRKDLSPTQIRAFVAGFEDARHRALGSPAAADPSLIEFTALSEARTNEPANLSRRLEILHQALGAQGASAAAG
jgi:hypothetical protein